MCRSRSSRNLAQVHSRVVGVSRSESELRSVSPPPPPRVTWESELRLPSTSRSRPSSVGVRRCAHCSGHDTQGFVDQHKMTTSPTRRRRNPFLMIPHDVRLGCSAPRPHARHATSSAVGCGRKTRHIRLPPLPPPHTHCSAARACASAPCRSRLRQARATRARAHTHTAAKTAHEGPFVF